MNEIMPKVSIVIPVYNTEKYLRKCLDSVVNQTLKEIEIICVNDCSTDNSLEILKEYAKQDNRITLIDFKENQGVAEARNAGIQVVRGEYIGFIDSDDYVDFNFYERLYECARENQVTIVKGNLKIYDNKTNEVSEFQNYYDFIFDNIAENKIRFSITFSTAIYQSSFIRKHSISFPKNYIFGEDVLFSFLAAYWADKLISIPNVFYHYYRSEKSTTREKLTDEKIRSYITVHKLVYDFINTHTISSEDYFIALEDIVSHLSGAFDETENEEQKAMFREFYKFILLNLKFGKLDTKIDSNDDTKIEVIIRHFIMQHNKKRIFEKLHNKRRITK